MKKIILKELKLVLNPAVYLFAFLAALLLVPNYPNAVCMIYFIFGVQIIFQLANSNRDIEFTALLPIPRSAIVFSKHFSVIFLQLLQIAFAIPCALISSLLLYKSGNPVGLDANAAFFGITLVGYAVFNIVFLPLFFRSGHKIGVPIVLAIFCYALTVLGLELVIAYIPCLGASIDGLNPDTLMYRLAVLIIGIIVYFAGALFSFRISVKSFERVNL